ncbi:MAG: putative lipid II flippase FtsW [Deltaproteobacteria bacterium]|nr:putative lipid II flippase FtsW [Deltaproteobacteria bacterium]
MEANELHKQHFDVWLLFVAIALVVIGVTMVYSSSGVLALERYGDSYYYLKRTVFFALLGFCGIALLLRFPYVRLRRWIYPILIGTLGLVLLVFIPGVGRTIGGATRWVNVGLFAFQPSEMMKIALILYLAYSLEKKGERVHRFSVGILPHLLVLAVVGAAILAQRDFGSVALLAMITWLMLFAAGAKPRYLYGFLGAVILAGTALILGSPYRRERVFAFLNPWSDQYGSGFQMIQSLVAFNEGGWFGQGLGEGRQKLFYLPEARTDFILSVVGEELGLLGVLTVILLFVIFCYRGFRIALNAPDAFGRLMTFGCTVLVGVQSLLNMGVVMGLLPTKGLTLPFMSYGGSSLAMSLVAVGLMLNVSSYRKGYE